MADPLTLERALLQDARVLAGPGARPGGWFYPSENAKPQNPTGAVLAPVIGATATILTFTVPRGFRFVIEFHFHSYDGTTAFREGSGALTWSLLVNQQSSHARAVPDMAAMLTTRGSPSHGPWPLRSCLVFEEGSVLSYVVSNVSQPVDSSSFVSAGLHGRLEPADCGAGLAGSGCGR